MKSSRRNWLRKTGFAIAGLSLAPFEGFAGTGNAWQDVKSQQTIRLRSNENPYGPSPMAREAMVDYVNESNRYGWDLTSNLISAIATSYGLSTGSILLGAGSTEILDVAAQLAAQKSGDLLMADPTYDYWTDTATGLGLRKVKVLLNPDKSHDLQGMLKAVTAHTRLVYVCNPNNPTGTLCNRDELAAFVREAGTHAMVLVDEAYLDFTSQYSLSSLVADNKNLIIAKTFSKIYGLAGARVGYAIAHPETINALSQMRSTPHGSVSVVSAAAAIASLKDSAFVSRVSSLNKDVRNYTVEQLDRLGISCIPSATNFVYFSLSDYKGDFFTRLQDAHILGTRIYEENGKWSRITIGTMEEMQQFIAAIK